MTKTELQKLSQSELVDKVLELEKSEAAAKKEVKALEETVQDMEQTIEDLNQKREDASSGLKVITSGKKRYLALVPRFKFNGKDYSYEDLENDEKLLAELLKIDGQQIVKLETK